jgi:hypothetical protein
MEKDMEKVKDRTKMVVSLKESTNMISPLKENINGPKENTMMESGKMVTSTEKERRL